MVVLFLINILININIIFFILYHKKKNELSKVLKKLKSLQNQIKNERRLLEEKSAKLQYWEIKKFEFLYF